jgi:hypothetical protein
VAERLIAMESGLIKPASIIAGNLLETSVPYWRDRSYFFDANNAQ